MSDQPSSKLNSVIAIVGPTATGKSALSFLLAEQAVMRHAWAGAVIISVDSRQVYRGLEVCTGADIPGSWSLVGAELISAKGPVYQHPQLPMFFCGISLIEPTAEWSVTQFRRYALPIIQAAFEKQMGVILVGGTGLYHEHLFSTDPMLMVSPNPELRSEIALLPLSEVQQRVQVLAPEQWHALNFSDRANLRRLVRVLEKQQRPKEKQDDDLMAEIQLSKIFYATVGITDNRDTLEQHIRQRIDERLRLGAVIEVEKMIERYCDQEWNLPAFTSTGCREVRAYIEEQIDREQLDALWTRRELQYAKRQLTWWKKHQAATSVEFSRKTEQWYDLSQQETQAWQTAILDSCILNL